MEDDRAQVDIGIAADVEEAQLEEPVTQKLPKKRFVGRRRADLAASKNGTASSVENTGAIQGGDEPMNGDRVIN